MNGNAELLNFIYQNSQMGVVTITQLMDIVNEYKYKKFLKSQLREYLRIHKTAKELLNRHGFDEKGISRLDKMKTYLAINMQTVTDKSPSHISEMLMIGSNMGIINAVKNLKKYKYANKRILQLMIKLLKFEESSVQDLKQFL